jgi:hypothetical protein
LIGEKGAQEFAIASLLVIAEGVVKFDLLEDVDILETAARGAVTAAMGFQDIEP